MLSWLFCYTVVGVCSWVTFSIWHGEREARFLIRKYGHWKGMMKYERKHRFCPYSLLHLWYDRYYPVGQPEYRNFKRALIKSRILNILAIQCLISVVNAWLRWCVFTECCYGQSTETAVELFREESQFMLAIYIIFPGILLTSVMTVLNYCDRKRGA